MTARLLDAIHEGLAFLDLLAHVFNGALENETLGSALAFQSGHELGEAIKPFANGLPALLF